MSVYFGDESTCERCDYPRRLHHLLGVEHEYTPSPNEKAPNAAATAAEGQNRTNSHEGTDSMTQTTPTDTLAELIGADWVDLTDSDREVLAEAHSEHIHIDLIRYFAESTAAVNRRRRQTLDECIDAWIDEMLDGPTQLIDAITFRIRQHLAAAANHAEVA